MIATHCVVLFARAGSSNSSMISNDTYRLCLIRAVENTKGQHQGYRRGRQGEGEQMIEEAVDEIVLGKHLLIRCSSMQ